MWFGRRGARTAVSSVPELFVTTARSCPSVITTVGSDLCDIPLQVLIDNILNRYEH